MHAARYVVTLSKPEAVPTSGLHGGGFSLAALLRDFAGVDVLRHDAKRAVVSMEETTAERLRSHYPFLSVEKDHRHRRA